MNHLQTLDASRRESGCDAGMCGLDLFVGDDVVTLQADGAALRRLVAKTHCNLIHLFVDRDHGRLALVRGWSDPGRFPRLTLNEVAPDQNVRLHSRISLAGVPDRFVQGAWELVKEAPWVQVQGPALPASALLCAEFSDETDAAGRVLCASALRLPRGVRLASPKEQVLFRLDAPSSSASWHASPSEARLA